MNEEYIDNVKHLIEQKDADQVKELLADLHPADIAELCNDLNPEEAKFVYRLLNNETAADVLVEMDEDARKELLDMLPSGWTRGLMMASVMGVLMGRSLALRAD